ncbi:MAG: DNA alkylation repair protein [Oscillospiraceae bacterium]
MSEIYEKMRDALFALAEPEYRDFSAALLPGENSIIGVRLPLIRGLASELARDGWRDYFSQNRHEFMEETLLQGMTIGFLPGDIEEILEQVSAFVPHIRNWSVCDSFCAGLKITKTHRERVWDFLGEYFGSDSPFDLRFGLVMLLNYYISEDYLPQILNIFDSIKNENYYVKMALAWALSMCYVKLPKHTMPYLLHNSLEDFTFNKALQKICDSRRVDGETKALIQGMKRKTSSNICL